jgi:MFS family permease
MLPAGGSAGALLAAPTSDIWGRKWSVFGWGIVFLVGAVMQMIADYNVLIAGRFIAGLGVGATSMLAPQFLAENSPKSIRGSMTATYNLMILMSLMLAFWINYGVSLWTGPGIANRDSQWRVALGIQLIPGAMMVLMVPFVPETPRYLSKSHQYSSRETTETDMRASQPWKVGTGLTESAQASQIARRTPLRPIGIPRDPSPSAIRTGMLPGT